MSTTEKMLPLYEGKMGAQYDHRAATFVGTGDTDIVPNRSHDSASVVLPRYWIRESIVADRLTRRNWGTETALLGFRRVARSTDERTVISTLLPYGAASYGWIISAGPNARDLCLLIAQYNSFVFDYATRQSLSQPSIPQGTFEQIPCLPPDALHALDPILRDSISWLVARVVALGATGNELKQFAKELSTAQPDWAPSDRHILRAEIDAACFHLYGITRSDVDYIMESFPIVKRKDEAAFGEFRTKRLILEIYDAMAEAMRTGTPYETVLDPPPASAEVGAAT